MSDAPRTPPPAPVLEGDEPKPWWRRWWGIAVIVLAVAVAIGALTGDDEPDDLAATTTPSAAAAPSTPEPTPTPSAPEDPTTARDEPTAAATPTPAAPEPTTPPPASEPTTPPAPSPTPEGFGSGTWTVGEDLEPGTYRSDGGSLCYWARLAGFSGELDDIIANGNRSTIVTIAEDDEGFETSDCGQWVAIDATTPDTPAATFDDGTFQVGTHVAPGTYRADAAAGDLCYWARLSDFSHQLDGIIANGNNPTIVTIAEDDEGFETDGCGQWQPVEATAPAEPATSFGDGTFQVGVHVAPGRYRADGAAGDLCYWARLSDFSHQLDGIIANGNDPTTIEIAPGDAGFETRGCGTWTRQ